MKALYKLALISIILLWIIYLPVAIIVMALDLILRIVRVKLPYWLVGTPFLLKLQNKVVNWYIRTDWERNRGSKTLTVG